MFHIKTILRRLLKDRYYTTINVVGLGVGMAAFLMIINYVRYEQSFDTFFRETDEIFRVTTLWSFDGDQEHYAATPPPLRDAIAADIPEVEAVVRIFQWSDFTMRPDDDHENVFRETNVLAVDSDYFKVFDYGLLTGDAETVLKEPRSVVLPRSVAVKYFGEEAVADGNIVGRKLLGGKDAGTVWEVTGMMEDMPANAHFDFEFLISANSYPDDLYRNQVWAWNRMHTYLRTSAKTSAQLAALQTKLRKIADDNTRPNMPFAESEPERLASVNFDYPLQALTDIHLHSDLLRELRPNGNIAYVNTFMIVALLVIGMAIVNFVNLATAQVTKAAANTGVHKILGANYRQLVGQHLLGSLIVCTIAGALAVVFALGMQSSLSKWLGDSGLSKMALNTQFGLTLLGLVLGTALLAGSYPAISLSRFKPLAALQGRQLQRFSDRYLRNGLVVLQLALSIMLIAGGLVVYQQVNYFQEKELGFAKNNLLIIENDREIEERKDVFKQELLQHPGVVSAGFSNALPGQSQYQMRNFRMEGNDFATGLFWCRADDTFLPTLDIEVLSGENFRTLSSRDSNGVILNEAAVSWLRLEEDPIGKTLIKNEGEDDEERLTVLGVVKDFHLQSPHQEIKPLAITFFQDFVFKDYVAVRLGEEDIRGALAHIKETWKAFEPDVPMQYSFLDENYDQLFRSEVQLGKVFGLFAGLAAFIAAIGLLGLITLALTERVREIGIRKVLGASVGQVISLFSKQFIMMVGIAFLIAAPLIWYAAQTWLTDFAYRIDLSPWPILLAGLFTLGLALLTVGLQSARAGMANPVDVLRKE